VGERFADVNVVNRVPHGGGGVMVWTGISSKFAQALKRSLTTFHRPQSTA
jgi:hypothetical protein